MGHGNSHGLHFHQLLSPKLAMACSKKWYCWWFRNPCTKCYGQSTWPPPNVPPQKQGLTKPPLTVGFPWWGRLLRPYFWGRAFAGEVRLTSHEIERDSWSQAICQISEHPASFQMTFWSPKWRSLNQVTYITIPKRSLGRTCKMGPYYVAVNGVMECL